MLLHRTKLINNEGITVLFSPQNGQIKEITLCALRLPRGKTHHITGSNFEHALVILSGKISGYCGSLKFENLGDRKSVFDGKASAIYLNSFTDLQISAVQDAEVIIASTPCELEGYQPGIIRPEDVKTRTVGKENWLRKVHDIIPSTYQAHKLIVGETFNYPGMWSSFPPHKHDRNKPPEETCFEEIYYFQISPKQGFGIQRVYSDQNNLDECYVVRHNDIVEIPYGYHPVAAGPGYKLYYLWVLVGESRNPIWYEDPNHRWINEQY